MKKRHVEKDLESPGLTLLSLLLLRKNRQATHPRDKVSAFVGIANDGDHPALKADYSKGVNVYLEVAMQLLPSTDPDFLARSLTHDITDQSKELYRFSGFDVLSLAYGLNEDSGLPT
jgi:hypothetical protein